MPARSGSLSEIARSGRTLLVVDATNLVSIWPDANTRSRHCWCSDLLAEVPAQSRSRALGPAFRKLFPQLQLLSEGLISALVFGLQVVKQATALANEDNQAAARAVVLLIPLQVFREIVDAARQQRDLNFGRPGVFVVRAVFGDGL